MGGEKKPGVDRRGLLMNFILSVPLWVIIWLFARRLFNG